MQHKDVSLTHIRVVEKEEQRERNRNEERKSAEIRSTRTSLSPLFPPKNVLHRWEKHKIETLENRVATLTLIQQDMFENVWPLSWRSTRISWLLLSPNLAEISARDSPYNVCGAIARDHPIFSFCSLGDSGIEKEPRALHVLSAVRKRHEKGGETERGEERR